MYDAPNSPTIVLEENLDLKKSNSIKINGLDNNLLNKNQIELTEICD